MKRLVVILCPLQIITPPYLLIRERVVGYTFMPNTVNRATVVKTFFFFFCKYWKPLTGYAREVASEGFGRESTHWHRLNILPPNLVEPNQRGFDTRARNRADSL